MPGRGSIVQLQPQLYFFGDTTKWHHCKSPSEMGFLLFVAQTSCLEIALPNVSLRVCHFTHIHSCPTRPNCCVFHPPSCKHRLSADRAGVRELGCHLQMEEEVGSCPLALRTVESTCGRERIWAESCVLRSEGNFEMVDLLLGPRSPRAGSVTRGTPEASIKRPCSCACSFWDTCLGSIHVTS